MKRLRGIHRFRPGRSIALGLIAMLPTFGLVPASADPYLVTVRGQGTELGETPVVIQLKARYGPSKYRLVPKKGDGPSFPARIYHDGGKSYLATVLKHVPAEGEETYSFESDYSKVPPGTGVEFRTVRGNVEVVVGGKPLTTYRTDEPTRPYFYPLFGPTGAGFTRNFPMKPDAPGESRDHFHHRSLWFTHGDVNGVDFWASDPLNKPSPKYGSIRETSRTTNAGPVIGLLKTADDWLGSDGKKVCEDEREVRFYDTQESRVIDFAFTIKATAGPVTFGDTKEGMFALRVASSMDAEKGKAKGSGTITNAEGVHDADAWGKASPWVDYTGPVEGKAVGIAILNHPESFRYPTTWHVRTYGLFAANPFGWHDFGQKKSGAHAIAAGEQITFRYRVILHTGDTASAKIADAFKAYANPPVVTLERE